MGIRKITSKWVLLITLSIGLIILFIGTFLVVDIFVVKWWLKDFKKVSVTKKTIPELFPILVITPGHAPDEYRAKTVFYKDLNDYLAKNRNYTFLVPAGKDEELNEELKQNSRASRTPPSFDWESPEPWWAFFEAERLSDGRQYLEVYHTWDDDRDNTSWYEATDKEVFPRYHQLYFGPGVVLAVTPISFLINCALWIASLSAYRLFRKKADARNSKTQAPF